MGGRRGEDSPVAREKQEDDSSQELEFHGARPLGARGPSKVRGARQSGQGMVSRAAVWARFSLGVEAPSSCLAFCNKCR